MLAERAKALIQRQGFKALDTRDGVLAMVDGDARAERQTVCVFPVYFEPSPQDGFAVAHVNGRGLRQWLCGREATTVMNVTAPGRVAYVFDHTTADFDIPIPEPRRSGGPLVLHTHVFGWVEGGSHAQVG